MPDRFIKDPGAKLDYRVELVDWLGGDTLVAASWVVQAGITHESDSLDATGSDVWVSGGTAGEDYLGTVHVTTAAGRQDEFSIAWLCRQK